jgi:hypothetical protein
MRRWNVEETSGDDRARRSPSPRAGGRTEPFSGPARLPADVPSWPNEPEEEDPEDRWPDPETELPNVPRAPEVQVPEPPTPESEASPELRRAFWAAVLFANVGLAGVALGPMLAYFRGQVALGAGVFALGVLALGRTYVEYRGVREGAFDEASDDGDGSERTDGGERAGDDKG